MAEQGGEEDVRDPAADETEGDALRELVRSGAAEPVEKLPSSADLAKQDKQQDIGLKGRYATVLLWLMGAQLAVTNGVFIAYAWVGRDWDVDRGVMQAWLTATVVQVIGVVLVVTRYLFPRRDE